MSATATPDSGIFRLPAAWPLPIPAEPPSAVQAEVDAMAALVKTWPQVEIDLDELARRMAAEVRELLDND